MRYTNFDIWIDHHDGESYPLRATTETLELGLARGSMKLALQEDPLRSLISRCDAGNTDHAFLAASGSFLHAQLFQGEIATLFQRLTGQISAHTETGIRLRLHIEPPEIALLPWELLHTPELEFLGALVKYPIVRYLDLPQPTAPLETPLPLQLLVVIPQPFNTPESRFPAATLDSVREKANLLRALEGLHEFIHITFLEGPVSWERINDTLSEKKFQCFHYIGHGFFDDDEGALLLTTQEGTDNELVSETRFAGLFRNHESMKLVVLNACQGAAVSARRPLAGVAPRLVHIGIPAVIAMQYRLYDDVAVCFSRELYQALFKGHNQGRIDCAISLARNVLACSFPDDRALATPVLFLRAREGILFQLPVQKVREKGGWRSWIIPFSRAYQDTAQALARTRQAILRELESEHRHTQDDAVAARINHEQEELNRLRQRIRLRNFAVCAVALAGLCSLLLTGLSILDPVRAWMEHASLRFATLLTERKLDQSLRIIAITEETEHFLGKKFDASWRKEHARLVERLSKAGARVIAFDMLFPYENPMDALFAQSIRAAKKQGVTVLAGMEKLDEDGAPLIAKPIGKALSGVGMVCAGKEQELAFLAPLAVLKEGQRCFWSLPLLAYAAFRGEEVLDLEAEENRLNLVDMQRKVSTHLDYSRQSIVEEDKNYPLFNPGDRVAERILAPLPAAALRLPSVRSPYEQVLNAPDAELHHFKGTIVFVGRENPEDSFAVPSGLWHEEQYGNELHVQAVDSLLQEEAIKYLPASGQIAITFCMAALGAAAWIMLQKQRRLLRLAAHATILLLYVAASPLILSTFHWLLNMPYHLAAYGIAVLFTQKCSRRWCRCV